MQHVLILDDAEKTDLDSMRKAAATLGLDVDATSDPRKFRRAAREHKPDLQIIDVKLPNLRELVGLSNGPELAAVTAAENAHVPTVFFTNFRGKCEKSVASLDPRLITTIVEKPVSTSPGEWRNRLCEGIKTVEARPDFDRPPQLGMPVEELLSNFFRHSPEELDDLSEEERDTLEVQATTELDAYLRSAWSACDADWLMLQKVAGVVLITNRGKDDELPGPQPIAEVETERGSPALVVGRPRVIEETVTAGPIECSPTKHSRDWRRYPFVRLIVGSGAPRDFHLDTGSPDSYVSREFLGSLIELPPGRGKRTVVNDLGGRQEVLSQLPAPVDLHVSGPHGNTEVAMRLQAVKNWHKAKVLNPKCHDGLCPDSADGQCGRRMGLMGRDLLYCVDGAVWYFNPASSQFYAIPESR